ncbi:MAG TPA: hypothetical protein VN032_05830 [Thermoanaerobaculia bacterium]|jgi:hypothetical protein|nr:hypothetical protein [Thermoanaerobaculia bacterium]
MIPVPGALAAPQTPFVLHASERGLLREVLAQTRVARTPAGPEWTGYVSALANGFARWLARIFSARPSLGENLRLSIELVAIAAVGLALGLLAVAILRRVRALPGSRRNGSPRLAWTPAAASAPSRDRAGWRREVELRLSRGDVAGALEALWWWLAASLAVGAPIDESWTTRELLDRARRPDLSQPGARLDTLMYGRRGPSAEDVTACLRRFEEGLS